MGFASQSTESVPSPQGLLLEEINLNQGYGERKSFNGIGTKKKTKGGLGKESQVPNPGKFFKRFSSVMRWNTTLNKITTGNE